MNQKRLKKGIKNGLPIGIGYFIVSFGFGVSAVQQGISPLVAVLMSLTNLTSAGQMAGVGIMVAGGGYIEMALTQLTINARYLLMGISLSQKLDDNISPIHRLLMPCAVTDEIFGVASSESEKIRPILIYGLMLLPYVGWAVGTLLGSLAGAILPKAVTDALGIAIYGMFVAIVIPPAKKHRGVLVTVLLAVVFSCAFSYLPILNRVSGGFALILCAVIASVVSACFFPNREKEEASI